MIYVTGIYDVRYNDKNLVEIKIDKKIQKV